MKIQFIQYEPANKLLHFALEAEAQAEEKNNDIENLIDALSNELELTPMSVSKYDGHYVIRDLSLKDLTTPTTKKFFLAHGITEENWMEFVNQFAPFPIAHLPTDLMRLTLQHLSFHDQIAALKASKLFNHPDMIDYKKLLAKHFPDDYARIEDSNLNLSKKDYQIAFKRMYLRDYSKFILEKDFKSLRVITAAKEGDWKKIIEEGFTDLLNLKNIKDESGVSAYTWFVRNISSSHAFTSLVLSVNDNVSKLGFAISFHQNHLLTDELINLTIPQIATSNTPIVTGLCKDLFKKSAESGNLEALIKLLSNFRVDNNTLEKTLLTALENNQLNIVRYFIGSALSLLAVNNIADIKEDTLEQARLKKIPILIKTKNAFLIYGDPLDNDDWRLTTIKHQFNYLPFEKGIIKRGDELFTADLCEKLTIGHFFLKKPIIPFEEIKDRQAIFHGTQDMLEKSYKELIVYHIENISDEITHLTKDFKAFQDANFKSDKGLRSVRALHDYLILANHYNLLSNDIFLERHLLLYGLMLNDIYLLKYIIALYQNLENFWSDLEVESKKLKTIPKSLKITNYLKEFSSEVLFDVFQEIFKYAKSLNIFINELDLKEIFLFAAENKEKAIIEYLYQTHPSINFDLAAAVLRAADSASEEGLRYLILLCDQNNIQVPLLDALILVTDKRRSSLIRYLCELCEERKINLHDPYKNADFNVFHVSLDKKENKLVFYNEAQQIYKEDKEKNNIPLLSFLIYLDGTHGFGCEEDFIYLFDKTLISEQELIAKEILKLFGKVELPSYIIRNHIFKNVPIDTKFECKFSDHPNLYCGMITGLMQAIMLYKVDFAKIFLDKQANIESTTSLEFTNPEAKIKKITDLTPLHLAVIVSDSGYGIDYLLSHGASLTKKSSAGSAFALALRFKKIFLNDILLPHAEKNFSHQEKKIIAKELMPLLFDFKDLCKYEVELIERLRRFINYSPNNLEKTNSFDDLFFEAVIEYSSTKIVKNNNELTIWGQINQSSLVNYDMFLRDFINKLFSKVIDLNNYDAINDLFKVFYIFDASLSEHILQFIKNLSEETLLKFSAQIEVMKLYLNKDTAKELPNIFKKIQERVQAWVDENDRNDLLTPLRDFFANFHLTRAMFFGTPSKEYYFIAHTLIDSHDNPEKLTKLLDQLFKDVYVDDLQFHNVLKSIHATCQHEEEIRARSSLSPNALIEDPLSKLLSNTEVGEIINAIYGPNGTAQLMSGKDVDTHYEVRPTRTDRYRFRINATACQVEGHDAIQITARSIPGDPPTLESMNLPQSILDAIAPEQGVVYVTGATGSGKSTLLAAIIRNIVQDAESHRKVLTYEAPIEFVYDSVEKTSAIVSQTEIPRHLPSFAAGVRNALRRKPRLILVGEARDPETISAVMEAAMTGHPVYTTLHSNGVAETMRRLVTTFPSEERAGRTIDIIETIRLVISQRLIPTVDGKRVALREYLVFDEAIRDVLLEADPTTVTAKVRAILREKGRTMEADAREKFEKGIISERWYKLIAEMDKREVS